MTKSIRESTTEKDVAKLERDNWQFGDFGILCDGYHVFLSEQRIGKNRTQAISIPKGIFDQMVDAYMGKK